MKHYMEEEEKTENGNITRRVVVYYRPLVKKRTRMGTVLLASQGSIIELTLFSPFKHIIYVRKRWCARNKLHGIVEKCIQ